MKVWVNWRFAGWLAGSGQSGSRTEVGRRKSEVGRELIEGLGKPVGV